MSAETHEGGCFCGAVRYRLESDPLFIHACHCRDCQIQTGGAYAINALIETDRITLLAGRPEPVRMRTDSGRPHDIYRCPECRTAVWSDYGGVSWRRFVRVTTLDDPAARPPDIHIFTRTALPWVSLPADVPVFEAYYDRNEVWPQESLDRVAAAEAAAG